MKPIFFIATLFSNGKKITPLLTYPTLFQKRNISRGVIFSFLLSSLFFLSACGNEKGQDSAETPADSLKIAQEVALRKEISSRALLDRIAEYQLLFGVQEKGVFNIYMVNGDGTNLQQLTDEKGNDMLPRWLPDATGFVFESDRNKTPQTYLFSFKDSLYNRVSSSNFAERSPHVSRDKEIVFVSDKDDALQIYRMDIKGQNLQKITNTTYNDAYPVWSPDALSLAFHTFRHDNQSDIYVTDRSGNNPIRITKDNGLDFTPNWSPNGKELVFVSNRTGNFDVYTIAADGTGQPTNLTNTPDIDEMMPSYSPDGAYIAYMVANGAQSSIYVMTHEGGISTKVSHSALVASMPSWRPPTDIEKALEADKPSKKQKVEVQIGN